MAITLHRLSYGKIEPLFEIGNTIPMTATAETFPEPRAVFLENGKPVVLSVPVKRAKGGFLGVFAVADLLQQLRQR
jgi:hypothetical protein